MERFGKWYEAEGVLRYSANYLVVDVEQDLADFYKALVPKYYKINRQRYPAHITVVRAGLEEPAKTEYWKKYDGEIVKFQYNSDIKMSEFYYWLDVLCKRLEYIREELGLSNISTYTRPPDGFSKYFHITIGNKKE